MMLEFRDVHVHYGPVHALRGINLRVREGEIVTLIGANGAGKSTLMTSVFGAPRISSGQIVLRGEDISRVPSHNVSRLGIALSPEGRRIFPRMTVLENLRLGATFVDPGHWGSDIERVFALFPILQQRQEQRAGTLSGGEQQMLAIGRALVSRPRLLLLDEPSLGLAPRMVDEMLAIARRIADAGTTVLMAEQNVRKALAVADQGHVMERGGFVAGGPAKQLARSSVIREAYLGVPTSGSG